MQRLEEYRALALQEVRRLMNGSLTPLLIDELLDNLIRHAKGLPTRPSSALPYERIFTLPPAPQNPLQDFRGDLSWVHQREGHKGYPYWPGGDSGVTLDPGVDVGFTSPKILRELYTGMLGEAQFKALEQAYKKFGVAAQGLLNDATIKTIRITFAQADSIMPYAAKPYWERMTERFPTLLEPDIPGCVHSVFLSLAYNRGMNNPAIAFLRDALDKRDFKRLAKEVADMQQNHPLKGIRERRKLEAQLIRDELGIK